MKRTCRTIPRPGEIRIGTVTNPATAHRYTGKRPYLVVSNVKYNTSSGQCEVIPFTTKRFGDSNPVHVHFEAGEVRGLRENSTLVVESRDILSNSQMSEPIGFLSQQNWVRVSRAMIFQNPHILAALWGKEQNKQQTAKVAG